MRPDFVQRSIKSLSTRQPAYEHHYRTDITARADQGQTTRTSISLIPVLLSLPNILRSEAPTPVTLADGLYRLPGIYRENSEMDIIIPDPLFIKKR